MLGNNPRMRAALLISCLTLVGCATTAVPDNGLTYARIGQTAYIDGPRVTPLEVLEDSRCPAQVQCVWAGRVRIRARIDLGSGSQTRELTLGKPEQVADGSLELVEVAPAKSKEGAIPPRDYRFGLRFMGGI